MLKLKKVRFGLCFSHHVENFVTWARGPVKNYAAVQYDHGVTPPSRLTTAGP